MLDLSIVVDGNMIGTLLLAKAATIAKRRIALHVHQREAATLQTDRLHEESRNAHGREHPDPAAPDAIEIQHPDGDRSQNDQRQEFKDIADGTQRTDILAPKHLYHETAQNYQRKARDRHPQHDLALESGSGSVVRIDLLAEQLAGREREVKNREKQHIFDDAQPSVGRAADRHVDLQMEVAAHAAQSLADRSQGAQIAAEELREEDHAHGQHQTHHDLEHRHRTSQRMVDQVGSERLQSSERTIFLHVDRRVGICGPTHRTDDGG